MTLLETTRLIEFVASKMPNINSVVETENIYDLNNDNVNVEYSAFCLQQQQHNSDIEGFITYNFNLYYIDRLTLNKANKLEVQSSGITILQNIINVIRERNYVSDIRSTSFVTFTEQFTANCAGVYCSIAITTQNLSLCADEGIYKFDFNDDFNKDFLTYMSATDLSIYDAQ